jgi:DNA-binding CsgD family transcriptional regulator
MSFQYRRNGTHACGGVDLTTRELDIVVMLALGASTARIAGDLFISPHTVAAHLAHLLRKIRVANRTELVARLYVEGVLVQGEWPPATGLRHICSRSRRAATEGRVGMSFDALQALRDAYHPVDLIPAEQQAVLAELTEQEVEVLNSVRDRLAAVAGEVEGQQIKLL